MNLNKKTKQNQGFTLIELMLAIGILSTLMLLAMPNLSQFVQKQKLSAQAEAISSVFSTARSQAISELKDVHVCWNPSATDNFDPKSVNGVDGDYTLLPGKIAALIPDKDDASKLLAVRDVEYDVDNISVVDDYNENCVTYSPQGRLTLAAGTTVTFGVCRASDNEKDSRSVTVSPAGRPMVKKNVADDGSTTISCS